MPNSKRLRSLRAAVLGLSGLVLAVFIFIFLFIFYITLPSMLLSTEEKYIAEQRAMVAGQFAAACENTIIMADDVAIWDATAQFINDEYPSYIEENWTDESILSAYQFNFVVMLDLEGGLHYEEYYDFLDDAALKPVGNLPDKFARISPTLLQRYATAPPATGSPLQDYGLQGILYDEDMSEPIFFSAMPIMSSRDGGSPQGVLFLGNVLDDAYFHWLTHYDTIRFRWERADAPAGEDAHVERVDNDHVSTYLPMEDIDGQDLQLWMTDARTIFGSSQRAIYHGTILMVIAVLFLGTGIYFILHRFVLRPLNRLGRDMEKVEAGSRLVPEDYSRSREFAALTGAINDMLKRLDESNISVTALQNILNGMDANLYVTDIDTNQLLFVNERMRALYGLPEDYVGLECWKVLQQGQAGRCSFCPIPQLLQQQDAVVWEEDNPIVGRVFRNTDNLIPWVDGRPVHIQHRIDITDQKTAEAATRRRLEQQELMTEISSNFISQGSPDELINNALRLAGEFMDVSKIVLARLDWKNSTMMMDYTWYNPKQNVPRLPSLVFPFDESDGMYDAFLKGREEYIAFDSIEGVAEHSKVAASGVLGFMTVPIYASGTFWGALSFDECLRPRHWNESDIHLVKLIGSVISGVITRSLTEGELVRLSSIVTFSPQYISYVNDDGDFEYFNPGVLQTTGYTAEELMDGGMRLLFSEEVFQRIVNEYLPYVLEHGKAVYELPLRRRDGETRTMVFSTFTAGAPINGVGAIASDITEQRRLEKDLLAAKDLAEQSSQAKGSFLSRMSHEMRTPMNAIIGMTNIAKSTDDAERKEYCLDKIGEASDHLLGVINDILDMSKIEAGKFELSAHEFNFEKMLQRVTSVMNFRIEEKQQNFLVKLDKDVPHSLVADEQRLAQVLTNLVSNAVKFTPDGGTITLEAHLEDEAEDGLCTLRMSVTDTGIGISPEQQGRLFTSFEQADGGISRRFGGTGLGLAISKSIVELMDGRIWVESKLDHGSSFIFTIKVRRGTASAPTTQADWSSLRVLVVDDAPEVREYFLDVAKTLQFSCEVAADGEEALARLAAESDNPFNIVFVDWRMPGMDGIQLSQAIKQRYGAGIVIIMISATQWDEIEHNARAAGVDGFIPKPLFTSVIVDSVNGFLGAAHATMGNDEPSADDDGIFEGLRVLVAEDIEVNREVVAAMLEHTGLLMDFAENGAEAIRLFEDNPGRYAMILMDIHMPEVDGFEATRRIRSLPSREAYTIPIVAMTANVFREDVEKCLAAGMNDHIGKPINIDEVIEKLKKYLLKD